MAMLFQLNPETMRQDAVRLSVTLAIMAAGMIGCFCIGGYCNGLAGASLTAKLRARGISAPVTNLAS